MDSIENALYLLCIFIGVVYVMLVLMNIILWFVITVKTNKSSVEEDDDA